MIQNAQAAQWAALWVSSDDTAMGAAVVRNECLVHDYRVFKVGVGDLAPVPLMKARASTVASAALCGGGRLAGKTWVTQK